MKTSSSDLQPTIPADTSIKAFSAIYGFLMALKAKYSHLFPAEDTFLVDHIINTAIAAEPSFFRWAAAKSFNSLSYATQHTFFNRVVSPGYDTHQLVRKWLIREAAEKAICDQDVDQLVFIGSGYDPRPILLAMHYPQIKVYELDSGLTRQIKLKALRTIPHGLLGFDKMTIGHTKNAQVFNGNLYCVEADIQQTNLLTCLEINEFDKNKKTLVIADGLTQHTNEAHLRRLLKSIRELQPDESKLIVSFDHSLQPDQVIPFMNASGYQVVEKVFHQDMLEKIGDLDDAKEHQDQPALSKEHYYVLEKSSEVQNIDINDVRDMATTIPFVIDKTRELPSCSIL